jgi:hypothetical protein
VFLFPILNGFKIPRNCSGPKKGWGRILLRSFYKVLNISQREKVAMRTAALLPGIGLVAEVIRLGGLIPEETQREITP